jgi:CTP synthase
MAKPLTIVVEHATQSPAIDCMYAAQLAAALSRSNERGPTGIVRLRGDKAKGFTETTQHVAPWGAVVPTGLLWVDRIADGTLVQDCDEHLDSKRAGTPLEIISINPRAFSDWEPTRLASALAARTANSVLVRVVSTGAQLHASMQPANGQAVDLPVVTIDSHGRPSAIRAEQLPQELWPMSDPVKSRADLRDGRSRAEDFQSIKIVLIGDERNFKSLGPALLASVGDAADAVGKEVEVEIVSSHELHRHEALQSIAAADGLLLPGGSDMGEVEGQVTAAAEAFQKRVPTLGVCLGMQSMVVSLTQMLLELPGANLEEVDPKAQPLVFRRLRDTDRSEMYRLGPHAVCINPGTRFADLYGRSEIPVRMAHGYHLCPELLPKLAEKGMVVGGQSRDGRVVDAIEFPAHPFFVGIQGHPEYSSRSDEPAGLLTGFLNAVGRHKLSRKPLREGVSRS